MNTRLIHLISAALVFALCGTIAWAQDPVNQIINPEFDDGLNGWRGYGGTGFTNEAVRGAGLSGANAAVINVTDAAAGTAIGLAQDGLLLETGVTYPIGFTVRAEQDREMVLLVQTAVNGSWPTQVNQTIQLTTENQQYEFEYTHNGDTYGDDAGETVSFYLMLKGAWWPMAGDALNKKVWFDRVYFGAEPVPGRIAGEPMPPEAGEDVRPDALLSWRPSPFADTHDVYFGTSFEDVNSADRSTADILVSQGQDANSIDIPGVFAFGQTYYWRVDEVNAAPDNTIYKGAIWSFTAEPFSYPVQAITATASSSHTDEMTPEKTIDGSGINALDQHSTAPTDMWLSGAGAQSAWIQYEFDRVYKLHEMWVWNSNQLIESFVGLGTKDVTVETSVDGIEWTELADVAPFAQATGKTDYTANTVVDFQGAMAQYVRINPLSGYGVMGQFGLSEVRFFYIPVHAREPQPASGSNTDGVDIVLSWRAGREAATHQVALSDDSAAVEDGSALIATTDEASLDLTGQGIELGTTYFWKIIEVNDAGTPPAYAGDLWSFSTPDYFSVESFNQYNDDCDRIFFAWLDGLGHNGSEGIDNCDVPPYNGNGTGSIVGNAQAPFAEKIIINSSGQSMPLDYDNSFSPFYSEAETTDYALPSDWTKGGADTLSLALRGHPTPLVENADGSVVVTSASGDIWGNSDEFRMVYKRLSGDGSIIARMDSLVNTWPWAKAGVMIRETLDPGSTHVMVALTPEHGIQLVYRPTTAAASQGPNEEGLDAPYWVKLTRSGTEFTAQRSEDGVNWVSITADPAASVADVAMFTDVYIGLAVTSNNLQQTTVTEVSEITTSGAVTGQWQTEDVGRDQLSNDAAPIYLTVEDGTGRTVTVTHPNPSASQIADWQEWQIPLSQLGALDLSNVKKLRLGVGDPDNPQADGAGRVYIDDISVGKSAAIAN